MMRVVKCSVAAALFLGQPHSPLLAQSAPVTVAVAELRTTGLPPDQAWLGRSFADAVIAALSRGRQVRVVEREFLDQLVAEQQLQSSAMVDERSAVRIGRLLGARVFIFGSVQVLGGEVVARARLVSVERGEILNVAEANGSASAILGVQRMLGREVASELAVESALSETTGLAVNAASTEFLRDLDRLRVLARPVPVFDLDPGRARRSADYTLGRQLAEKLASAAPRYPRARYYAGLFALQMDDLDVADRESRVAVELDPRDPEYLLLRGHVLRLQGQLDEARAMYQEATARADYDARGWYALGRVALAQNEADVALDAFVAALSRAPAIDGLEQGAVALVSGDVGRSLLQRVRAEAPGLAAAGRVLRMSAAVADAPDAAAARAALEAYPTFYPANAALGFALMPTDPVRAEEQLLTALALRPGQYRVHRELGLAFVRQRRCDEGLDHIDRYVALAPNISDFTAIGRAQQACRNR